MLDFSITQFSPSYKAVLCLAEIKKHFPGKFTDKGF